jgi:hypothetical protein
MIKSYSLTSSSQSPCIITGERLKGRRSNLAALQVLACSSLLLVAGHGLARSRPLLVSCYNRRRRWLIAEWSVRHGHADAGPPMRRRPTMPCGTANAATLDEECRVESSAGCDVATRSALQWVAAGGGCHVSQMRVGRLIGERCGARVSLLYMLDLIRLTCGVTWGPGYPWSLHGAKLDPVPAPPA